MDFTITIADEFLPGVRARLYQATQNDSPTLEQIEEYLSNYASSMAEAACKDCKVGPHWEPPATPEFNADGTPYTD